MLATPYASFAEKLNPICSASLDTARTRDCFTANWM